MRVLAICLLIGCLTAPTAYAHSTTIINVDNERRTELGVGMDLILHEGKEGELINKVTAEGKYDWQNGDAGIYAVVTTKLSDIVDKIKGLKKSKNIEE